ncbi:hypothetical protein, partial [Burkholderia sp. 140710050-1]
MVQSSSRSCQPDFSVVSLKSPRRDFPLADACARCARRWAGKKQQPKKKQKKTKKREVEPGSNMWGLRKILYPKKEKTK